MKAPRLRNRILRTSSRRRRRGAATLDYVLVLGIILPLAAIVVPMGKRIIQLVYEMTCVWLAWPFM